MELDNFYIDSKDKMCQFLLNKKLCGLVEDVKKEYDRIAVLCIGTDACTGDSFGPLVGHFLSKCTLYDFDLYGTIHSPVHAKNLVDTLSGINLSKTLVIAVDACLGKYSHIGNIGIGYSPVKPGSGLGKSLPEVGDIHIEGIVNISGFHPLLVLQNTRLSIVYSMAEITARAIRYMLYTNRKMKATVTNKSIKLLAHHVYRNFYNI